MKRLIVIALLIISHARTSAQYEPTEEDAITLQYLIPQIDALVVDDRPTHRSLVRQLDTLLATYDDPDSQIYFLLDTIHTYLDTSLRDMKEQTTDDVVATYESFYDEYSDQIQSNDIPLPPGCFAYTKDLDMLSFVYDVSLPVLIATRYRESTCGYYLPANTRGPMQIISHDYGTGSIEDHEIFIYAMSNYADFAHAKYDRYNRVTDSGEPITLSYESMTYDDVVKHSSLYNGLSGGTIYGDI
jgi:hypothetical protein